MDESRDPAEYGSVPAPDASGAPGHLPAEPDPAETGGGRRPRRRVVVLLALAVVVLAGAGTGAWFFLWATDEDRFLGALEEASLLEDFGSAESALAQGEAFCAGLRSGDEAAGYKSQRVAVEHLCPDFLDGFEVIPTPEEQAQQLWDALAEAELGGRFPSEASAVAHAEQVCVSLETGDAPQGPAEDAVSVSVYCEEYAAGFRTLHPLEVDATFTLLDTDPSTYYPSIEGGNNNCHGASGYGDIRQGTEVVVRDTSGTVLTTTTLSKGSGSPPIRCKFGFSFTVMEGKDGYSVEVSDRGDLHYTDKELAMPGAVTISLGQ